MNQEPPSLPSAVAESLRVLVVAGIPVGVLVGGVLSRLAMLLLRVTSPDSVIGLQSDDDFEIGRFTLGGTYSLLMLGAAVGIIGAGVYQWVSPWLLGPRWFRWATCAAGAGVVVGSMLIHTDGIDFRLLKPTWLAIGLFIALPAIFGGVIGPVVDAVKARQGTGRRRWLVPVVLVACFPATLFILLFATLLLILWHTLRLAGLPDWLRSETPVGLVVRVGWLAVAGLGMLALRSDIAGLV